MCSELNQPANSPHDESERPPFDVVEFFGAGLAERLSSEGRRADVIHAHNVLAHVADLNGFVQGLRLLLKDDGIAVIEVPYVKDMIDRAEFDTVYHEHLCYFSLTTLDRLFRRHGLVIQKVSHLPIHGGTLRIFASRAGARHLAVAMNGHSPGVPQMIEAERAWGVEDAEFYRDFAERVERLRLELLTLLRELKTENKRIAVYGASAKGSTLSYFGIAARHRFCSHRSTVNPGRYTPGTHLSRSPAEKLLENPDYVLRCPGISLRIF